MSWLPWRPYRCVDCNRRVWRYGGNSRRDLAIVVAVAGVFLVAGALVSFVGREDSSAVVVNTAPEAADIAPSNVIASAPGGAQPAAFDLGVGVGNNVPARPAPASPAPSPEEVVPPSPRLPDATVKNEGASAVAPESLYIERIDADLGADGMYAISLRHNGLAVPVTALTLENPSRLVVDLEGTWPYKKGNPPGQRNYGVGVVKKVRLGRVKKQLRVVVDILREQPFAHELVSRDRELVIRLWPTTEP